MTEVGHGGACDSALAGDLGERQSELFHRVAWPCGIFPGWEKMLVFQSGRGKRTLLKALVASLHEELWRESP